MADKASSTNIQLALLVPLAHKDLVFYSAQGPCILVILRLIEGSGKFLAFRCWSDSDGGMIRGGFLGEEDRNKLIALARDGAAASRMTRRANALVLLDDGWSCREVAKALLLDDDTIRGWRKLFEQGGIEGLTSFDMGGSAGFMSA